MPPNKQILYKYKNSTKPQKIPQQNVPQTSTSTDLPNQEQFEVELHWCIQQLQALLSSAKLNNKQVQDHTKALNILMSNTSPIIRKRQVMRLSFGDYREKMAAEEKKLSKNATNMKLKTATPNKKTIFLKKSLFASSVVNNFTFNFNIQEENTSPPTNSNEKVIKTVNDGDNFHFTPSNNTFRFDFKVENEL